MCAARSDKDPQDWCQWLLEGTVEFHRDESTREQACSEEPRFVNDKENYPENQNPTW